MLAQTVVGLAGRHLKILPGAQGFDAANLIGRQAASAIRGFAQNGLAVVVVKGNGATRAIDPDRDFIGAEGDFIGGFIQLPPGPGLGDDGQAPGRWQRISRPIGDLDHARRKHAQPQQARIQPEGDAVGIFLKGGGRERERQQQQPDGNGEQFWQVFHFQINVSVCRFNATGYRGRCATAKGLSRGRVHSPLYPA